MKHILYPMFAAAVLVIGAFDDSPALAQSRVFVSIQGADSNPCSVMAPCRTFQRAHDVVSANGEIDVLDPGGYGALNITKAISIQGHGFSGISVPSGGTGITINPISSTAAIHLNGLLIEGGQIGATGIIFSNGKSLTVENCVVRNMTGDGLALVSNPTTGQKLAVSNSYFNDNNNGIVIDPRGAGAQPVSVSIDRTGFYSNSGLGLWVFGADGVGKITVAVMDSTASNNGNAGFVVQSSGGQSVTNLSLTHVLVEGNGTGVSAGSSATLWLAQSTVSGNTTGFSVIGGVINSYQDNYFAANGTNTGSLTNFGKQ